MTSSLGIREIAPTRTGQATANTREFRTSVTSVELKNWNDLSAANRNRWLELRESRPDFKTPFFSLGFIDAVQASRSDVKVAMLHDEKHLVGMLPIHVIGNTAYPAGRFFNDAHNVVMKADTHLNWVWMLQRLGLRSFDFHALVGQVASKDSFLVQNQVQSFCADLTGGSQAFIKKMEREHGTFRRQDQKTRKMQREIGEVTLQLDCRDHSLLDLAISWKRQQYQRTRILDLFTPPWTRRLMESLHAGDHAWDLGQSPTRGLLSVLRAGGHVVAIHYGMIENGLLHYWFPSYNPEFAKYSPGTALFKEIARQSAQHGIRVIDMGYGEQPYKRKQTDTISTVRQGCVSGSKTYLAYRQTATRVSNALRSVPMKTQLKWILRSMKPNAGISKIR